MKKPRAAHILITILALLGCVVWAVDQERAGGKPTNFGVKDGSVPEDPRDYRRGGNGNEYPTWPVSKELPR